MPDRLRRSPTVTGGAAVTASASYFVTAGDTVFDSDGQGQIYFWGTLLTGNYVYDEDNDVYVSDYYHEVRLFGSTLYVYLDGVQNDDVFFVVLNFSSGDLGINLVEGGSGAQSAPETFGTPLLADTDTFVFADFRDDTASDTDAVALARTVYGEEAFEEDYSSPPLLAADFETILEAVLASDLPPAEARAMMFT